MSVGENKARTTRLGGPCFGVPERIPTVIRPLLAHSARSLDGYASPVAKNAATRAFSKRGYARNYELKKMHAFLINFSETL